jgi:CheY-like chemotaxis protein
MENKNGRFIYTDDDEGMRVLVKSLFKAYSGPNPKDLELGENGNYLWENVRSKEYDGIITDDDIPGRQGLDTLEDLRSEGIKTPAILVTGKSSDDLKGGIKDRISKLENATVLFKPFDICDFKAKAAEFWPDYFSP